MVRLTDRRLDWGRLAAGFPTPLPQGGRGSNVALGRYFAWLRGGLFAGKATPHMPSPTFAPFAPRAARTTGSVATTIAWPHNWVRAGRFYFSGHRRSGLFKVDQQLSTSGARSSCCVTSGTD